MDDQQKRLNSHKAFMNMIIKDILKYWRIKGVIFLRARPNWNPAPTYISRLPNHHKLTKKLLTLKNRLLQKSV